MDVQFIEVICFRNLSLEYGKEVLWFSGLSCWFLNNRLRQCQI